MAAAHKLLSRRRVAVILGVLVVFLGALMLHPYPRQSLFGPTIRGKPWCAWENEARRHLSEKPPESNLWTKSLAWVGIRHQHLEADEFFNDAAMIPLVLHLADDPDPAMRRQAVSQFFWHPNLRSLDVLPILRARLADDDIRMRIAAAQAIVATDPDEPVHQVLTQILDDPKSDYRVDAVHALTYVAAANDDAFDALLRYAKDRDQNVRNEVIWDLFRHGKRAVPTLIEALGDPEPQLRLAAAEGLGNLRADARPAIPALTPLLKEGNVDVRREAAAALMKIDPQQFGNLKAN